MAKPNVFKLISFAGLALGGLGTLLSNWADDKELDRIVEEKVNEKLAANTTEENHEES